MAWRWKESLPLTSRARGNSPDTAGPDGPGLHGPCLPRGSARRLPGRSLPSSSRASSTAERPTPSLEHEKGRRPIAASASPLSDGFVGESHRELLLVNRSPENLG